MNAEERKREAQLRETIELLIHSMRLHHRIVEKRIDGLGVHHSQHRLLMRLSRMGKSASQKDIAAALDVSPACVARMLKPLDAAGLVEKTGGADGRCNVVSISPGGRQLVEDSLEVFRQIDERMFEGVTGEELAALSALMKRVQANLVQMEKAEAGGEGRDEGSV